MKKTITFLLLLVLAACNNEAPEHHDGYFPETVTNLTEVNSVWDDYNSAAPTIYDQHLLHFSSNRHSSGENFDIVGQEMFFEWSKSEATFEIGTRVHDPRFDYLMPMFDSINTPANELGPYSIGFHNPTDSGSIWTDLFLFANDEGGVYNIKFTSAELWQNRDTSYADIKEVDNIDFLNSSANDLYPSFMGHNFWPYHLVPNDHSQINKILFCSDREGPFFNLYEITIPQDSAIIQTLKSDIRPEARKLSINSEADDKCPYVNGRLMVFASNREGGYGGYDLYYSRFEDDEWSTPENFGEKINTEYDEYRPVTIFHHEYNNTLMIFSSNRPGGKGGFDLYYIGINQELR